MVRVYQRSLCVSVRSHGSYADRAEAVEHAAQRYRESKEIGLDVYAAGEIADAPPPA